MAVTNKPAAGKAAAVKGRKTEYDNTNRGVLFLNNEKTKESSPDFTGRLSLTPDDFEVKDDGTIEVRLAAWNQSSPKVGDYLSIVASQPQKKE